MFGIVFNVFLHSESTITTCKDDADADESAAQLDRSEKPVIGMVFGMVSRMFIQTFRARSILTGKVPIDERSLQAAISGLLTSNLGGGGRLVRLPEGATSVLTQIGRNTTVSKVFGQLVSWPSSFNY